MGGYRNQKNHTDFLSPNYLEMRWNHFITERINEVKKSQQWLNQQSNRIVLALMRQKSTRMIHFLHNTKLKCFYSNFREWKNQWKGNNFADQCHWIDVSKTQLLIFAKMMLQTIWDAFNAHYFSTEFVWISPFENHQDISWFPTLKKSFHHTPFIPVFSGHFQILGRNWCSIVSQGTDPRTSFRVARCPIPSHFCLFLL